MPSDLQGQKCKRKIGMEESMEDIEPTSVEDDMHAHVGTSRTNCCRYFFGQRGIQSVIETNNWDINS